MPEIVKAQVLDASPPVRRPAQRKSESPQGVQNTRTSMSAAGGAGGEATAGKRPARRAGPLLGGRWLPISTIAIIYSAHVSPDSPCIGAELGSSRLGSVHHET